MAIEKWRQGEVKRGVPVDTWNALVENLERGPGNTGATPFTGASVIRVVLTQSQRIGDVVGLGRPSPNPEVTSVAQARGVRPLTLLGESPQSGVHDSRMAVLLEGGDAKRVVTAVATGPVWARLNITDTGDTWAAVSSGSPVLVTGETGVPVIWKETITPPEDPMSGDPEPEGWGVVLLGGSAAGGGSGGCGVLEVDNSGGLHFRVKCDDANSPWQSIPAVTCNEGVVPLPIVPPS